MIVLVTPEEDANYFALAEHLGSSLADLVRGLLNRKIEQVERGGAVLRRKRVKRWETVTSGATRRKVKARRT
jgi:hypothetical protein